MATLKHGVQRRVQIEIGCNVMDTKTKLTNQQRVFVEEYLKCWNATEAARRAGYSKNRANASGWQVLHTPSIQDFVKRRIGEIAMGADEVLLRLAGHARGSVEPFLTDTGDIDLKTEKAKQYIHLLKKAKVKRGTTKAGDNWVETEIELHDPQSALVHLGRHLALFLDKEVGGDAVYREHIEKLRREILSSDESTPGKNQ